MEKCKPMEQEWFQAVERGNLLRIQKLLKDINDIDFRGSFSLNNVKHNGVTGLIIASNIGNKDLVRWFLANKADANASTHLGWRAIHFAAKRGHVATIDMLCSSGAAVDPVTMDNDTPLMLALQSHMRDSARKLVNLGAQIGRFNEGLLCRYIHRGVLPAEVLSRAHTAPDSPLNRSKLSSLTESASPSRDSSNETNKGTHRSVDDKGFASGVHDSQIIINQLQCQSTGYDLELARRKRELIRRLPTISSLAQQTANTLVQQTQRLARADLPTFERLQAVRKIFSALPLKTFSILDEESSRISLGTAVEPYLRLFEACMCESHCPSSLAGELSVLSVYFVALGGGRNGEINGSGVTEDCMSGALSSKTLFIASYITRLLRKLVSKNNPQYRAGILAHLCRMLSSPDSRRNHSNYQKYANFWSDMTHFTTVLSGLVRLGETLDQPINVARLAALIGLVGHRLSEVSLPSAMSSSVNRFSDLADILVGWGVDPNSATRGINLESIYTVLRFGLSSWWLHSPNKPSAEILSLNPSMHEMMCHLLEDSEKSMNTAVIEYQALTPSQTVSNSSNPKPPSDPTPHLISVNLFLSILWSIIEGVHSQLSNTSQTLLCHALGLSDVENVEWFDRLLQLAKSAQTCYRFSWMLWHTHGPVSGSPRVSFSVVDKIELTVLRLLDCFSQESLPQAAYGYLTNRLLGSKQPPMSSECLNASLKLLQKFVLQCLSEPNTRTAVVEIIHTCFGVRSIFHAYKFSITTGGPCKSMSKLLLNALCLLAKKNELHDVLCQLVALDLKLAVRFCKFTEKNEYANAVDCVKCETLGLFSLSVFSVILKHAVSSVAQLTLRKQMLEIFNQECALWWSNIPSRLRIAMIAFFNDESFLFSLHSTELIQLTSTVSKIHTNSPLELNCICSISKASLNSTSLTSRDRHQVLTNLCKLARKILRSSQPLQTFSMDPFVMCVRIIITHAFTDELDQSELLHNLFRLCDIALCSNLPERKAVCGDLLLALGVSKIQRVRMSAPHLGLAWYTTRRPDRSATALVVPPGASQMPPSNTVVGSGSAYPSLPAVAGVLGFLTRGAPYSSATTTSSRLQILREPSDWIRRLFHLICPIPAEMIAKWFVVNAEETVLWYAAWTMIDYKLKVAPWVNPLKTFLSLEGTIRAILRPHFTSESKSVAQSNSSDMVNFHMASSLALARQPWPRQIRQAQSLMTFLGFLERLIENATNGFSVSLPRPVSPACTFFAANEATCSQWFSRVRGPLLCIADNWPLPPVKSGHSAGDVPASVLYHGYSPLSAILQSDPADLNYWLSGLPFHGVSCDVIIRVAKALHRLTAWEELQALSEWTTRSFISVENPFTWIEGLALLTRGQWDRAVEIFRSFIDRYVHLKQTGREIDSPETAWTLGFAYTAELLLQCYLDEGDIQAALALRDLVTSALKRSKDVDESSPTSGAISSFKLSCMRLSYVEKLANWSPSTAVVTKGKHIEVENIKWWSHKKLTTKLCHCLIDTALAIKSHANNTPVIDSEAYKNLSNLVTDVRLASSGMFLSSARNLTCHSEFDGSLTNESSLCAWLIRSDLLLSPRSRCLNESDLANCHANTVNESSWRHLLAHPDGHDARLNSGLQGCRWACDTGNFQLARRLMMRELKALSFIGRSPAITSNNDLEALYSLIRSVKFSEGSQLSQIQRLLFGDCLAQLLWCTKEKSSSFDFRLAAIDTLSRGLRTVILEEVTPDPLHHAARCYASTQVALRLFDWLESPSHHMNKTWVEWISREHSDVSHKSCPTTSSVVNNLNFFSRLVDEPWVNGLPLVPSADLPPSSHSSIQASSHLTRDIHSVWLSRLLMMTTRLAPTGSSSAAWFRMANWCYAQGQTMVKQTRAIAKEIFDKPNNWINPQVALKSTSCPVLQLDDYHLVGTTLEQHGFVTSLNSVNEDQTIIDQRVPMTIASLLTFLTLEQNPCASSEAVANDERTEGVSLPNLRLIKLCPDDETNQSICDQLSQHLHQTLPQLFPSSKSLPTSLLETLHRLVIGLTQRQYTLHTSAAQAYATYLTVAGQRAAPDVVRTEEPITRLDTTTATLKLLDLLSCPSRALRNLIAGFLMHGEPASQVHHLNSFSCEQGRGSRQLRGVHGPGTTLGGPAIWEACLHQVLVRLSLPDPAIRTCLIALLTRLILTGRESESVPTRWRCSSLRFAAHLVFPSVVAATDSTDTIKASPITKDVVSGSDAPEQDSRYKTSGSCFVQIVSALQNAGFSALVRQVETFVLELQRLTLLWEELWLGCLLQHLDELTKKVTLLETELKRSVHWNNFEQQSAADSNLADKENRVLGASTPESNLESSTEQNTMCLRSVKDVVRTKFVAVAQPTLDLIARLSSLTLDVQPETPHEEWFQRTFGSAIRQIRENLSHPKDIIDGKYLLNSVRQLICQLQTVHQSSSNVQNNRMLCANGESRVFLQAARPSLGSIFHLSLSHLSPRLTQMQFGDQDNSVGFTAGAGIPLPGRPELESAHLINRVAILPTKTKPKRLLFRARNGQTYPYLLKGLEDLRLDDRIMRLFELINIALAQQKDVDHTRLNQMCARTYAITPLGVRAGLLQMVHGAVPLFSLYKRWQIRSTKPPGVLEEDSGTRAIHVPRPGVLFHTRLKESLLAAGLPYQPQARNTWSMEALRDVFLSLEAATPSDLLSRELWAANPSAASWWSTSRTFSRSMGVMSMLGYLVGLGDRHLDNLLTDLTTGHIIHIDYNVCFDKGRTLRVAERVPFRLTHILRHTLGPLAQDRLVRGTFRVASEQTLTVARSVIDPFLIQLKAFLIDPLVDWQDKKQSALPSSVVVTDFTHLSAYYGGGSSATRSYHWASCARKRSRVSAELRTWAGLLATRLYDLSHSTCLQDVCSALTTARSCFQVWVTWCQTSHELAEAENNQKVLVNSMVTSLDAAEIRCKSYETASTSVLQLRSLLCDQLANWKNEVSPLCEVFSKLSDPIWLPSLMTMQTSASSEVSSALTQYYVLARIYLAHPGLFADDNLCWTQEFSNLQTTLEQFIDGTKSLDACLNRFSELGYRKLSREPNKQLVTLLEQAIHRTRCAISELQDSLHNNHTSGGGTVSQAIRSESDNLHLFVYDQGVFGISAYVWALIDYLPGVIANILSLESESDSGDSNTQAGGDAIQVTTEPIHLNQLAFSAEYLAALFTVLHNQLTGTFQFTAGFEIDMQRDVAFMYAVRDAVVSISQLHTNLVRLLLLPETELALIDAESTTTKGASGDLIEQFTSLMAHYVTESDPLSLRDRVNHILFVSRTALTARDMRLHQVLLAVHLALTNTTTQLEEIAVRIRELTVTEPTWFYVDIVAQSVSNLLARCQNWRSGATSLWGWEQANASDSQRIDVESGFHCSWIDEVYAMGLMAFVSVLEEERAHWSALRGISNAPTQDIVLNYSCEAIDRFVSRLVARTGLASLLGFASGRFFCSLVEDTGVPIRRLLMENDHNAKVTGVHNVMLQLSAEKLAETAGLHLASVQPAAVHHLRSSASTLIQRLVVHANQASEYFMSTIKLESARRHLDRLQQSLTVLNWISPQGPNTSEKLQPNDTEASVKLNPFQPTYISNILSTLEQAVMKTGGNSPGDVNTTDPSLRDVAMSVCFSEKIRISGIESYSGYIESLRLLKELKLALLENERCSAQLTDLDKTLLGLKSKYNLDWPAVGWLDQPCATKTNRTLRAQMQADLCAAKARFNQAHLEIMRVKSELLTPSTKIGDGESSLSTSNNNQPTIVMNRYANKRPSGKHTRSNLLSSSGLTLSSTGNDLSLSTSPKLSSLTVRLRTALTALQSQRLAELRQLVKLLSRYESARTQFAVDDAPCLAHFWTNWLDKHQTWTSLVLSTLRQLSQFLSHLGSNSRSDLQNVSITQQQQQSCTDRPDELKYLNSEAEIAERLLHDCTSVHSDLWFSLLEPLFEAVKQTIGPEYSLSNLVSQLLIPVQAKMRDLIASDLEHNQQPMVPSERTSCSILYNLESNDQEFNTINPLALEVWWRTRDRLIGRDPLLAPYHNEPNSVDAHDGVNTNSSDNTADTCRGMPVHEQVEACIRAATDIDNLALMYEGWTAWV
ncbi:PI-3-kinase kinase SMG-1 [Fasciola hepatica]|uniref:PI-3-kinase kinase SMG-1 n=1 Tax=Fasciola hepatica TaxID=6192 RepID=A0A4E0RR59_FASHE|nr:PI-3-kinase kinase SMG-1 [Fasciola hepatica]